MKKGLLIIIVAAALAVLFTQNSCENWNTPWNDDGRNYFCPDCEGKMYVDMLGTCARCGETTTSYSFKYCYECAKEIGCCQYCGKGRYHVD